jgi:hypothetical protein
LSAFLTITLCFSRFLATSFASRGGGKWKQTLLRTFDILNQYGYAGYNFESHVPAPLNRKMVFEAFMAFKEFQSEDRYGGLVSSTTIYNYAIKHYSLKFIWLAEEQSRAGFYGSCPGEDKIATTCRGRQFLSFDDDGFGLPMARFLEQLFPVPSKFERAS